MASLILSTSTNPGEASWQSGAGSVLADGNFGFVGGGGTINTTLNYSIYCQSSAGAVPITVGAAPVFAGQTLTFLFVSDGGGDIVITFPAVLNAAGNTVVTMNDAGDSFGAIAITTDGINYRWVPMFNNGCTLS